MCRYEVRSDDGRQFDTALLVRYFGSTWREILGRFNHRHDGYLFTLHEKNGIFNIYRVTDQWS